MSITKKYDKLNELTTSENDLLQVTFFYYDQTKEDFSTVERWELEIFSIILTITFTIISYSFVWNDYAFLFLVPLTVWVGTLIFLYNRTKLYGLSKLLQYYEDVINCTLKRAGENINIGLSKFLVRFLTGGVMSYIYVPLMTIFAGVSLISSYFAFNWMVYNFGLYLGFVFIIALVLLLISVVIASVNFKRTNMKIDETITKSIVEVKKELSCEN